jgi:hypothetical protein
MIPDIQSIFDSTVSGFGPWVYVGNYSIWTLYGLNVNDGTISVQGAAIPTNLFVLNGPNTPTGAQSIGLQINNIVTPVYQPSAGPWRADTSYALTNLIVDYNNNVQKCTTAGISGTKVPTFATSSTTVDNTVTWTYQAAQGSENFNMAISSSASASGVVLCPSMSSAANLNTGPTGYGVVLYQAVAGSPPTTTSGLYIPSDDIYVGYIRVIKTGGGSLETIVYICGQVES